MAEVSAPLRPGVQLDSSVLFFSNFQMGAKSAPPPSARLGVAASMRFLHLLTASSQLLLMTMGGSMFRQSVWPSSVITLKASCTIQSRRAAVAMKAAPGPVQHLQGLAALASLHFALPASMSRAPAGIHRFQTASANRPIGPARPIGQPAAAAQPASRHSNQRRCQSANRQKVKKRCLQMPRACLCQCPAWPIGIPGGRPAATQISR